MKTPRSAPQRLMSPRLNVARLVNRHFGDAQALARLAASHGIPIPEPTVRQWMVRNSMSSLALLRLVQLCRLIGQPLDLAEFLPPVGQKDVS